MIKVVETSDKNEFECESSELMKQDYKVSSSNCGFINLERYNFCPYYQAILVKEGESVG